MNDTASTLEEIEATGGETAPQEEDDEHGTEAGQSARELRVYSIFEKMANASDLSKGKYAEKTTPPSSAGATTSEKANKAAPAESFATVTRKRQGWTKASFKHHSYTFITFWLTQTHEVAKDAHAKAKAAFGEISKASRATLP